MYPKVFGGPRALHDAARSLINARKKLQGRIARTNEARAELAGIRSAIAIVRESLGRRYSEQIIAIQRAEEKVEVAMKDVENALAVLRKEIKKTASPR